MIVWSSRGVHHCKMSPESRPAREINNILQIIIKFTLEANNRTRGNTSYIPCCCDCVGVCGNVCCVAAVVKDSVFLALKC